MIKLQFMGDNYKEWFNLKGDNYNLGHLKEIKNRKLVTP